MIIPLGEWLPDLPPLNNPGALVATNVIPGAGHYLPMPGMTLVASLSAAGHINGAFFARDQANNTYTYAGDNSALYVQSGSTFNVATRTAGGAYAVVSGDNWEFVSWGQTVIGVDGLTDVPQQISLGGAFFAGISGAPKARHIAVIKDFVVLGNVSDSATQVQRVRWSAINNSGAWSVDATTLADFQDLPGDGGWIQKVVSGEQGYVFQERAIWRMTFVGSPLVFTFDKIHDGIGAYAAQSVCTYENNTFFLSAEGFKQFDGTNLGHIGRGKVDETFYADLDVSHFYNIRSVIVSQLRCVFWTYPGVGSTGGLPNHILVYSYAFNRWARIDIPSSLSLDIIAMSSAPGYTLDGLDAVSSSIDALAFSLDDRAWTGGNLTFSAYVGKALYYFTATPMDASVQTNEVCLMQISTYSGPMTANAPGIRGKFQVNEVWPIVQGLSASSTVVIATRNAPTENPVSSGALTVTSAGFVQAHHTARFHRFTINTTGDFDSIQGLDVIGENAGKR